MAGYLLLGTMAAFGVLSFLWAVLGWCLPRERGCVLVCLGEPDESILWRWQWLSSLGLLHCPLVLVTEEQRRMPGDVEICSREELLPRLERERNQVHGTGNGDHTGCGQRRGISEL